MVNEHPSNPFRNLLKIKEIYSSSGTAEVKIDLFPDLFNFSGNVHGGVLASLIDISIGSAVRSTLQENQRSSTVELKINYIKPANGLFLLAKSSVSHRGTTLVVGTSEIFNDQNQVVAIGTATFFIKESAY
ncbi:PaaI family thioesterase [Domibacillus sp. PGB-M46]|uniref:PaaI family thioesterase n=1 Tax=Domibacillus sp. PGB-M46 TaxID=2910255 RepID=UPI001F5AE76B|nr:PaaI family thioesterase [Domibacillus sp. PGB-M46]MCI2256443.1 PaaI family thioesterase [Domibacillus sp. PGB-M46]